MISYLYMNMEIDAVEFVQLAREIPVLDVRSPGEYEKGHVCNAHSFPLFSNNERAEIGTMYKQVGRQPAFERGLELVGPKIKDMVIQAQEHARDGQLLVHCWRGGMRSQSVGQLLQMSGMQVRVLKGGYKSYRRWVLDELQRPRKIRVLGGMTGSGKTKVLQQLEAMGEVIVDLEGMAHHSGSVFGHLQDAQKATQQQFENDLADKLWKTGEQAFWVEHESARIGGIVMPQNLIQRMETADFYLVEMPMEQRIQLLIQEYGDADPNSIRASILRIRRRLGGLRTQQCLGHLDRGEIPAMVEILLGYYDKFYRHSLEDRQPTATVNIQDLDFKSAAKTLLQHILT